VATQCTLYILNHKTGVVLKEHAARPTYQSKFAPDINTVYVVDESRALFWWKDGKSLAVICMNTFEVLHCLDVVPSFSSSFGLTQTKLSLATRYTGLAVSWLSFCATLKRKDLTSLQPFSSMTSY
jgi:hypothetical protein